MNDKSIQLGNRDYDSLYNVLRAYRRASGKTDTIAKEFNRFDNPGTLYFRIFFDFQTGLLDCVDGDNGRDLGRHDQLSRDDIWDSSNIIRNSALNYLTLNNEWERADMLRNFINLLSNISTYSPWYFMGIDGIGDVLERTEYTAENYTLPEVKTVTIKCAPDSYDQRIGTLLDLYRAMCYSQQLHKEIIPANLRRFNMYIYIFPANTRGIHTLHQYVGNTNVESKVPDTGKFASFDQNQIGVNSDGSIESKTDSYLTSSKLILLKGCEIDINASKSGYESVANEEGFTPTYSIPIRVRYAEEQRYNEFLMKRIGDLVVGDMDNPGDTEDGAGNARDTVWDAGVADAKLTFPSSDDRIDESLPTGMSNPKRNEASRNSMLDYRMDAGSKSLETSIYRDGGKTALYDPWLNMGKQQAERLASNANQVLNAGKSAVSSYTDIEKLNGNAVAGVNGLVNRLVFGNIFETNLQSVSTGLASGISSVSSGRVIDSSLRGKGWTRSISEPAKDIGGNIFEM